jgi:hypothetical protein
MDAYQQALSVAAFAAGLLFERMRTIEKRPYIATRAASTIAFAACLYSCPSDAHAIAQAGVRGWLWSMRAALIASDAILAAHIHTGPDLFSAHKTLAAIKLLVVALHCAGGWHDHADHACAHIRSVALPCTIVTMYCVAARGKRAEK